MAFINLSSNLKDPAGGDPSGNLFRFTHMSTTGQTVEGFIQEIELDVNGYYNVDLQYGNVMVTSKDVLACSWTVHGTLTINSSTPATDIPSLLGIVTPPTDTDLLVFQALVADASQSAAESEVSRIATEALFDSYDPAATVLATRPDMWEKVLEKIQNGDVVKIVCLGDSLTAGSGVTASTDSYPVKLKEILDVAYVGNSVTIVNKGVAGNTASQMLARFATDVLAENPDGVIIMAGMNDLRTRTVTQYVDDLKSIYDLCIDNDYGILALDITPRTKTTTEGIETQGIFRAALHRVVSQYNLRFVDLFNKISDITYCKNGFALGDITYDGTHYLEQGYLQIAGATFAFGMSSGQIERKIGDNIEPFGPHLSLPSTGEWTYQQGVDSINNSRAFYQKSTTDANAVLMIWISDYEFCDLNVYLSVHRTNAVNQSIITAKNNAISTGLAVTSSATSFSGGSTKTVFGRQLVLETLQPGWNEITIGLAHDNTTMSVDGFNISPRDNGIDSYKAERFLVGERETTYEKRNADEVGVLTHWGVDGLLSDGANRKLGSITNSTTGTDYYAWYMQINRAATVVIRIGEEMTDVSLNSYFVELTIAAAVDATTMNASLHVVYRDGTRHAITTDTFTATDKSTLRFSLGQSSTTTAIWTDNHPGSIASTGFVTGVSNVNISSIGGSIYVGKLFRTPKSIGSSHATTPFDGEEYIDIESPAIVKAIGGILLSSSLT